MTFGIPRSARAVDAELIERIGPALMVARDAGSRQIQAEVD
jgi:hypothetical protein